MREEFELAWQISRSDDEGNLGGKPTRSKIDTGRYAGDAAQFAWVWWKRSRESLVVDLPLSTSDGQRVWLDYEDVELSLNKAGVNYK